jgi:branched-chain amino acid transport system substrate-binding protein
MKITQSLRMGTLALGLALTGAAPAADTIKIGLMAPFSGPFADYGKQFEGGVKAYLKLHGDSVAGKKVEIITKDTTGPAPELGKRLAQELVVRDKVDFLAVGGFTPETLTAGSVATAAKVPLLVLNASSVGLPQKAPYAVRICYTFPQIARPLGNWAAKNGIKRMMTLVTDYGPGIDAESGFKEAFTAAGGEVVDSLRVPLKNPEFSAFIQRVKDTKPDALFVWVPAGDQIIGLDKTYYERGLDKAGIKLISLGDGLDEHLFAALGDQVEGMVSSLHYSTAHDSPENKAFIKTFAEVSSGTQPTFMGMAGYDGMAAIYATAEKLKGDIDGPKALAALSELQMSSPRGSFSVDPKTRDVTQTVYIRRVGKVGGKLDNIEFQPYPDQQP